MLSGPSSSLAGRLRFRARGGRPSTSMLWAAGNNSVPRPGGAPTPVCPSLPVPAGTAQPGSAPPARRCPHSPAVPPPARRCPPVPPSPAAPHSPAVPPQPRGAPFAPLHSSRPLGSAGGALLPGRPLSVILYAKMTSLRGQAKSQSLHSPSRGTWGRAAFLHVSV